MLTDRQEILKWLKKNDHNFKENKDNNYYEITADGFVDCLASIDICEKGLKEIPIKFRKIHGDFICDNNKLKSCQGFPLELLGGLDAYDNRYENFDGLTKDVGEYINLIGKKNILKIEDLGSLPISKFQELIIKYKDETDDGDFKKGISIFPNDGIPEKYLPYVSLDDDYDLIISFENYEKMIEDNIISSVVKEKEIEDYLNLYDEKISSSRERE